MNDRDKHKDQPKPTDDKPKTKATKARDQSISGDKSGSDGSEAPAVLRTVPYDPRFPNQNQTRNCYQNYLDFYRCLKVKNNDEKYCHYYRWAYTELCPKAWIHKWDDQRDKGIFAGRI